MSDSPTTAPRLSHGCVQVYTGDGKGKTTAALGLALRAAGAGLRVFIGQFMKAGRTAEMQALEALGDRIRTRQYGTGQFVRDTPTPADIEAARCGLAEIAGVVREGRFDVVILDEAAPAVHFGLFSAQELIQVIESRPPHVELVITGRRAPREITDRADLVTEMRAVRHYYDAGVPARHGIEE